jgi:hypothetical protein
MRKLRFGILFGILAVGLLFLVNESQTGFPNQGVGKTFTLPVLDSFTNVGGSQIDVQCKVKQTLTVVDGSGSSIDIIQSGGIQGSPTFLNIVNPNNLDEEVSVFVVIPKISCKATGADITIEKSDLKLTVAVGSGVYTDNIRYNNPISFPQSSTFQTERNLGWFSLSDNDIEAIIPETDFTAFLAFDVTGNIDIHYDQFPSNTMTIPLNIGDLQSFWKFTNVGDNDILVDTDGDGIRDNADACPSSKETYNGYQDTDGCPDSVPSTSSTPMPTTTTNTTPTDAETCTDSGKIWSNGVCSESDVIPTSVDADGCIAISSGLQKVCPTDSEFNLGELCYQKTVQQCADIFNGVVSDGSNAKIKFQIDIKLDDNTVQAFQVQDDPDPFNITIPLSSLTGNIGGNVKRTADFTVEPRIVFDDAQFHKLVTIQASDITIEPIVTVKDVDYSLGEKSVRFVKSNGGSVSDPTVGLSIGEVIVRAFDIENAVPLSVIPLGSSDRADVRFLVDGDVTLIGGDGTFTERIVSVSGADFAIVGLQITRQDSSSSPDPNSNANCSDDENTITISGITTCVAKGKTSSDSNPDATPSILDPSTLICIDDTESGKNGFPCTEDYRIAYCGSSTSTDCGAPVGDDGNGATILPPITSVDANTCPDSGLTSLSLSDNACVIFGDNTTTTSGSTTSASSLPSGDNTILIIAVAVVILGVVAYAVKRRQ